MRLAVAISAAVHAMIAIAVLDAWPSREIVEEGLASVTIEIVFIAEARAEASTSVSQTEAPMPEPAVAPPSPPPKVAETPAPRLPDPPRPRPVLHAAPSAAVAEPGTPAEDHAPPAALPDLAALPEAAAPTTTPTAAQSSLDSEMRVLYAPRPVYPAEARRLNRQGSVLVQVIIGEDGRVATATLTQSSGFAELDAAAMQSVGSWRFTPPRREGKPAAVRAEIPVRFSLQ